MGQGDEVDHAVWHRRRGARLGVRSCLCRLERTTTGQTGTRLAAEPGILSRLYRSVLFWTACLGACCTFGGFAVAAETSARPISREFNPFDILAWEILAGIEASEQVPYFDDAQDEARTRIAVWPFSAGRAPVPGSLANEYNDKLLVSLLSQGGSRYRFIARKALSSVVKEIDESTSHEAELNDLLSALVERAKADVLVVGKLRRTSDETIVLSYEAVRVRDGTILAATSHQRLALDPAEVELAARSEALAQSQKPTASPKSENAPDFPIAPGAGTGAEPSTLAHRSAEPIGAVAAAQADLWELGYDPGPIDGLPGARTSAAIRAYQRDAGLPVDGLVSGRVIASLRNDLAVHKAYAAKAGPVSNAPMRVEPIRVEPIADRPSRPELYRRNGTYCREFRQNVRIGGAERTSYGRACLQADGAWQIVK